MPASPADGARHAHAVADIIADAEATLLRLIATHLREGDEEGRAWAARKLLDVQLILEESHQALALDEDAVRTRVRRAVLEAFNDGAALALADLDEAFYPMPTGGAVLTAGVFTAAAAEQTTSTILGALRLTPTFIQSAYVEAVTAGAVEVLGGKTTRLAASQHVLDRLASEGVTGFTDRAGRHWSLSSYTEMAVRTATGNAAVDGHAAQLRAAGLDLVMVSDSPRECPACRPWEHRILSLSGATMGQVIAENLAGGPPVRVDVVTSLGEARRKGLFHPNCTHTLRAYLPGATKVTPARSNPDGYEAKQRQRTMERKIREWKRREAAALTEETAAAARARVRDWQATLRGHVDAHDLKRLRYREQVGTPTAPLST